MFQSLESRLQTLDALGTESLQQEVSVSTKNFKEICWLLYNENNGQAINDSSIIQIFPKQLLASQTNEKLAFLLHVYGLFYGRRVPLDSITQLSALVHERLGVKQVVLNALIRLTFILYFKSKQGPRGWSPKGYLRKSKQPISPTLAAGDRTVILI